MSPARRLASVLRAFRRVGYAAECADVTPRKVLSVSPDVPSLAGPPPPYDASDEACRQLRLLAQQIDFGYADGVLVPRWIADAVWAGLRAAQERADTPQKAAWRRRNAMAIRAIARGRDGDTLVHG